MTPEPRISIISPAFNAASFYDCWIANIQSQNYLNLEVVLVDDGSSDDIGRRAQKGPSYLRYVRQENQGPAAARNTGILESTGELIAFLDLDDLWDPGHLRRMAEALHSARYAQIAQGLIRNFCYSEDGRGYFCSRAYRFINLGSAVFRREVFDFCGNFDERMRFGEDFDFLIRCWEQGMAKYDVNELSLFYHRHATNMTNGRTSKEMGAVLLYKRHLDRVRAGKTNSNGRSAGVDFPEYIGRNVFPFDEGIREPV